MPAGTIKAQEWVGSVDLSSVPPLQGVAFTGFSATGNVVMAGTASNAGGTSPPYFFEFDWSTDTRYQTAHIASAWSGTVLAGRPVASALLGDIDGDGNLERLLRTSTDMTMVRSAGGGPWTISCQLGPSSLQPICTWHLCQHHSYYHLLGMSSR